MKVSGEMLVAVCDQLMALSLENIRPEEGQARFRLFQKQHPEAVMELLWEEEAYGQLVHYDALLSLPGEGTVSLSFCPERGLPWPLRGAHRWSEMDLVRVNKTVLRVSEAIAYLEFIWDQAPITDRLVNACLVEEALAKEAVEFSNEELQVAMTAWRRAKKLYTSEDTYRWMERHGVTHEKLERRVADAARVAKLRDRVSSGRVEEYFAAHSADFDTAFLARFEVSDREKAYQTWEQIRQSELDFYEAAEYFCQAAEPGDHRPAEFFTVIQRGQASPEWGTAVFAARPGQVLEPFFTGKRYALVRVVALKSASVDGPTRSAIKQLLFEQWLEERRQEARIEWYWGNAVRSEVESGSAVRDSSTVDTGRSGR